MKYTTRLFKMLTGCAAMLLATTAGQASDMGRRYLAIDQTLHGTMNNVQMVLGQATNSQEILPFNAQWEIDNNMWWNYGPVVIRDHEGLLRMYYPAQRSGMSGYTMAVAYSTDGINWQKPSATFKPETRNLAPHLINHPDSNLINMTGHSSMTGGVWSENTVIFYDPTAPVSQRYKAAWYTSNAAFAATSSDGLNFGPSTQILTHRNDTNLSAFWDPIREAYVVYGRIRGTPSWTSHGNVGFDPGRRGVALHHSTQWASNWHTTGQVGITVLDPEVVYDYSQSIRPDFYAPDMFHYHGQYIGMPPTFFRDSSRVPPDRPELQYGTGPIYPIWAHSHDGVDYYIPDKSLVNAHSAIDLTPHLRINPRVDGTNTTDLEVGQMYPSPTIVEMGDKLLVYYSVREDTHYEQYPNIPSAAFVAEMRVDGFASIKTPEGESGQWLTSNDIVVPVEARGLLVNAKIQGELKVEVRDSLGNVISGLSLADSVAFTGDETGVLMKWASGQFEQVAGQEIQLRFVFDDGEIYSFSFSPIPEPASLMLMGLGGLALLRRKRVA